ncbi:MAG: hypothetical protein HY541_08105 [Deltaproteobacteria bacterium]|nr:hypothetical protein [Deltaproteobacteria bacterium]
MGSETNLQNVTPANLRVDYSASTRWLGPEAPKLTFWQKLGRGLAKVGSYVLPVAAAVAPFFGPLGLVGGAAAYGLNRFSNDQLYKAQVKDQIAMANQPVPQQITMPGLFESSAITVGDQATEFIAPTEMNPGIEDVVIQRDASQKEAVLNF